MCLTQQMDLKALVDTTLERLCEKYPYNDHQYIMRASFEIFAVNLLSLEYCNLREIELYEDIKNGFELLNGDVRNE